MRFVQSGKETLLRRGEIPKARLHETDVAIKFDITPQDVVSIVPLVEAFRSQVVAGVREGIRVR